MSAFVCTSVHTEINLIFTYIRNSEVTSIMADMCWRRFRCQESSFWEAENFSIQRPERNKLMSGVGCVKTQSYTNYTSCINPAELFVCVDFFSRACWERTLNQSFIQTEKHCLLCLNWTLITEKNFLNTSFKNSNHCSLTSSFKRKILGETSVSLLATGCFQSFSIRTGESCQWPSHGLRTFSQCCIIITNVIGIKGITLNWFESYLSLL